MPLARVVPVVGRAGIGLPGRVVVRGAERAAPGPVELSVMRV
ncbi:hypothetical protein [Streptomyces sp. NPDC047014]